MTDDPFAVLGVGREATLAELRAARRRLAFDAHPDRGGDPAEMRRLNIAFDAAVGHVTGRRPLPDPSSRPSRPSRSTGTWSTGGSRPQSSERVGGEAGPGPRRSVEHDVPSFVVEALPVETFEALLVVAAWIGEVLVDEPPYLLEVHLHEPSPCWCRLELVPDAGASTVSLTVAGDGGPLPPPPIETVRDVWVAHLNRL